jgi:cyclase
VHALLANQLPKDNNGLIVGERAALLVDAGVVDLGNF